MRGSVENVEVGSFAESPLKPLRNRLCLLKALGLPLRIEDEEATVVKTKKTCMFFAILLLFFAVSQAPAPIAQALAKYNSNKTFDQTLYQKNGLSKWAYHGEIMFYCLCTFRQFIFLPFYHRLAPKFEKFTKHYLSTSKKLGYGEF